MTFHFELRPVEQIRPWTNADGTEPYLSWFGLTYGWFWVDIDGMELFRYSDDALKMWDEVLDGLPYADYQVARFWEDLLEATKYAMNPVPVAVAARVEDGKAWQNFLDTAFQSINIIDDDGSEGTPSDNLEMTVAWWRSRNINTGYMLHLPELHLWRVGEMLYLRWDNRGNYYLDGIPAQAAPEWGEVSLPFTDFLQSVGDFHAMFMVTMAQRVAEIEREWTRPEIAINLAELRSAQKDRLSWFEPESAKTMETIIPNYWQDVEAALNATESLLRD